MIRFTILLSVSLLIIASGCKQKEPIPPYGSGTVSYCGSMEAQVNGEQWIGQGYYTRIDAEGLLNVRSFFQNEPGEPDETLGIHNVKAVAGIKQQVFVNVYYPADTTDILFGLGHGDMYFGSYKLIPSDTNAYVTIDSLSAKKAWGRFGDMTLVFDIADLTPQGYRDTVQVTNGVFEICLKD